MKDGLHLCKIKYSNKAESSNKMAETKTNVMRLLDQKKIPYTSHRYPHGNEAVDGLTVAKMIGRDPACVFKTLVARGASKACYVFVIPVTAELELKKAARAVGEKSISMVHVNELLALTGLPIGMKKQYKTVLDESAFMQSTILVSAGKIGSQVELSPADLIKLTGAASADLTTGE